MTLTRRRVIQVAAASSAALLLPGAARASDPVRWSGVAMGADASLAIAGIDRGEAERLIASARAEIGRMEALFSLYRADSAIVRLNRDGRLSAPPADMLSLLSVVDTIHRATDGAFDPTVQPVWALLAKTRGRPDRPALADALAKVGWQAVTWNETAVALAGDGMALTLNGIAQGFATDRVAALLKRAGLDNVLVSVGEIAALGEREPGRPWRIGLAEAGDGNVEETLTLTDMAVATSAPDGTLLDADGTVGHILDPRHGPAEPRWRRVTVTHASAAIADGLSTAFALMPGTAIVPVAAAFRAGIIAMDRAGNRLEV